MTQLGLRARDALRRLHGQGRIASPWLPGMRGLHLGVACRVIAEDESTDPWVETLVESMRHEADDCPDVDDPATQGCLLALAEEAVESVHDCERTPEGLQDYGLMRPDQRAVALVVALEALAGQP